MLIGSDCTGADASTLIAVARITGLATMRHGSRRGEAAELSPVGSGDHGLKTDRTIDMPAPYLRRVWLDPSRIADRAAYPFCLPFCATISS